MAWLAGFEAKARRSLETRPRHSLMKTYKPVPADASFRAFDTMPEYRTSCETRILFS